MAYTTRFAPSPTGPLHLGHAYSAIVAHNRARALGGTFLLRIEDLDSSRARPEWEAQIYDDLAWLDLSWPTPVLRQSDDPAPYKEALDGLIARGLCYPCVCTRGDIRAALSAPQEGGPAIGPDGPIYPGTCRGRPMDSHRTGDAIRLDMARAVAVLAGGDLTFEETGPEKNGHRHVSPRHLVTQVGDIVLGRKEAGTVAYHLAVTVDDARQQITEVVRGADLFEATAIHVLLQRLLGLPTPHYHHHRLIRDEAGKRLAKRDDARAISRYRDDGLTPQDIRAMIGLS